MKRVRVGHEPTDPTKIYLTVGKERVELTPHEAMRMGEALLNEGVAGKIHLMNQDQTNG